MIKITENIKIYNEDNIETFKRLNDESVNVIGKIICYFEFAGVDFSISATTNDMHAFDRAMDIDNYEERQIALYDIIKYKIEEEILSEMYEIDEE